MLLTPEAERRLIQFMNLYEYKYKAKLPKTRLFLIIFHGTTKKYIHKSPRGTNMNPVLYYAS